MGKYCPCSKVCPLSAFRNSKAGGKGKQSYCRICQNKAINAWNAEHRELVRQQRREARARAKVEVLAHYSKSNRPKCALCGERELKFLCLDHVHGAKDKRYKGIGYGRGADFYRRLRGMGYPPGFQTLCLNCNIRKCRSGRITSIKEKVLTHYGHGSVKCKCCGEDDHRCLALDHIKGDGKRHRFSFPGDKLYWMLLKRKFPKGFRVLCYNCNFGRGQYGKCPHKESMLYSDAHT